MRGTLRINSDPVKKYWDIGEIERLLNEQACNIRYWCKMFGLELHRSKNNYRKFTKEDVIRLTEIHRLLRVDRYTIEGAKKKLND